MQIALRRYGMYYMQGPTRTCLVHRFSESEILQGLQKREVMQG